MNLARLDWSQKLNPQPTGSMVCCFIKTESLSYYYVYYGVISRVYSFNTFDNRVEAEMIKSLIGIIALNVFPIILLCWYYLDEEEQLLLIQSSALVGIPTPEKQADGGQICI